MKRLIKEIKPYCYLYKDDTTGIAWVEDGRTDIIKIVCIHPSMGTYSDGLKMQEQGYWEKDSVLIEGNNKKCFNISKTFFSGEFTEIVTEYCDCQECRKKKLNKEEI